MSPIARATLRESRTTLIGSAVIVGAVAVWVCAVYPSFRETLEDLELPAGYEAFLGEAGSLATPAGFLSAEFFSWIPALWAGVAIALGTAAIGGEESDGTLELLLAQPVSRTRVLAEKCATLAAALAVGVLSALPAFALGLRLSDLDISLARIAGALGLTWLLALVFLLLGVWLSALLPSRRHAALLAAGGLIAAYFLNTLGAAVPAVEPWRVVSPLYWSDASLPLTGEFRLRRIAALVVSAPLLLALARDAFSRREIGSGSVAWPRLARRRAG